MRDNTVSFSSSATEELVQDQMTVTLQAVKDGTVASEVQSALKAALDSALVEARKAVQSAAVWKSKLEAFPCRLGMATTARSMAGRAVLSWSSKALTLLASVNWQAS